MTRIDNALTYAQANGANSEPPLLVGVSMGAGTVLRWAANHPTHSVAGIVPGLNFQQGRIDNPGGTIRGLIDAAWGVTYPAALPAGANPSDLTYTVPIHLWYAPDDVTASPSATEAFAAAKGATLTSVGNLNHTNAAVAAAYDDVIEFILTGQ
jgi:pimeloyl-ACP methyl ester carboxylesterase